MAEMPPFPPLSPSRARDRFLVRDDQWDERFKPGFDQFIIASFAYARPVIKLPVPPARTGNHALFLVEGGAVELTIGHHAHTLGAGSLVLIPAMQIFAINDIRADTAGYMCFFSADMLLTAADTTGTRLVLSPTQLSFLLPLFGRLLIEYAESGGSRTDLIRPYLRVILAELDRIRASTATPPIDAGDRLVQGFMGLLDKHSREKSQVNQYADLLSISPNHLNKIVKARTGQSPSVWIDKRRVLEAKVLLYQSALSIGQIAAELGFSDQANFGKVFRRHAAVSPSAFRKLIDSD